MTAGCAAPRARAALVAVALLCGGSPGDRARAAPPQSPAAQGDSKALDEVIVTARREIDRRTLDHVVIPKFVESHGAPNTRIDQIGRWRGAVCPTTLGLQPLYNEFVSRRIVALARSVGAPVPGSGRCRTNVEILFTPDPQTQLDYVLKKEPALLGYSPAGARSLATQIRPIQAWYVTGTRSYAMARPAPLNASPGGGGAATAGSAGAAAPPMSTGYDIDSQWSLVGGAAGSHLGAGLRSEFVNVLVLADSTQVSRYSLGSVADYIAVLVLTRTGLAGCNELPSIVDLFSPDCGTRAPPQTVTEADTAYLKALYSSDLELQLNLERGELHDRMLRVIEGR